MIIEDEERILMALEDNLKLEGYRIDSALDGEEGLSRVMENKYDLIILDIMLPKMNGFDVCRQIRQKGISTPILMLTAKSQEIDKVLGLELGADDYVTKPFSSRELLARVKALLRRAKPQEQEKGFYDFGDLEIDFKKYEAKKREKLIFLTALEFSLLSFWSNTKERSFPVMSSWMKSGVTMYSSSPGRWISTLPSCAKRSRTTRLIRDTFWESGASGINLWNDVMKSSHNKEKNVMLPNRFCIIFPHDETIQKEV